MFLGMNPAFKPWGNKKVRQAVAYAVDRKAIIKSIFQGGASILDGPVGPGQYGYNPNVSPKYTYNPAKARQLLKEAGYPNGVAKDILTPEYSSHWPMVRKGKRAFFYQGRGSVVDPSAAIAQYFETGVAPRLMYSNPKFDAIVAAERMEFDSVKRKKLLLKAFNIIQEDVPAFFLWRIDKYYGISKKISFTPNATDRIFGHDITLK